MTAGQQQAGWSRQTVTAEASVDVERLARVREAASRWIGQLVDLSGRNTLLYYRDLKVGTLDLGPGEPAAVDVLLSGRTVRLSALFPDPGELAGAARRARAIRAKAVELFEERGIQTLHLARGMATWDNQRGVATPAAPILLQAASLVPRGPAAEDFDVSLVGDPEVNPTLLHLLRTDYQIDLDDTDLLDLLDEDNDGTVDPARLFARLTKEAAAAVSAFAINERLIVGTFSYAKLPMVRDLETFQEALAAHNLIAAIAGDEQARQAIRDRMADVDPTAPDHTPPADEFLVLDADASQNYAINAAVAGQDLVIKGPPGTGKSQTIANLITTLAARGQRVLFVAEKRAAIDAVLSRLAKVGLDDLVMDLHRSLGSRRKFAQILAKGLREAGQIPLTSLVQEQARLERRRSALTEHVAALHAPRQPWEVSIYQVQCRLLGLPEAASTPVRLSRAALAELGADAIAEARDELQEFVARGGLALSQATSPWAEALVVSGKQAAAALETVDRLAGHTLPVATRQLGDALAAVGLRKPASITEWRQFLELLNGVRITQDRFGAEAFHHDLAALAGALTPASQGRGARLRAFLGSASYRQARRQLHSLCLNYPPDVQLLHQAAQEAANQQARWRMVSVDDGGPRLPATLANTFGAFEQLQRELGVLARSLPTLNAGQLTLEQLADRLAALRADHATLLKLPVLHALRAGLQRRGLTPLLEELQTRQLPPVLCVAALEHAWLASIYDQVALADPRIGAFDGQLHHQNADDFRRLDATHIAATPARVKRACAERLTRTRDQFTNQSILVEAQAARQRGHKPIRELFAAAPQVLTALKPCWAMSPLLVSQLLPADRPYFDVVIFDEASQVLPADALPALLRADRAVVAGDDRQLPPTSFFTAAVTDEDAEAEAAELALTSGFESILDTLTPLLGMRMLTWHYRSHDERLIAFSNLHLYDQALTTCPGITGDQCLEHVLVAQPPGLAGQEDSSSTEVQLVVQQILDHAQTRPDQSLGVITMGIKHANRITAALRQARAADPQFEAFFDETLEEAFFVKNLERVQGDERDAIILSVGYGKTPDGRLLYRFGPLLQQGGERRLNVAITRAKQQMMLVSSFAHTDMDPSRSHAEGVRLLTHYLEYAASRGSNLGRAVLTTPALDPFEISVRDALTAAGIPLLAQYGASGYRIDFAARHPTKPGRMVLAIECDGASYHAAPTARDRDRLRQDQLETLGWSFHRIWSTDWFHNQQAEVAKALPAYQRAVAAADELDAAPSAPRVIAPRAIDQAGTVAPAATAAAEVPTRGPKPPVPPGLPIDQYSQRDLIAIANWIESDTLLRTEDQVLAEVMRTLGFQRRGSRIVAAIQRAIRQARQNR
jgi:very-short-patch-repair endonuclease